MQDVSSHERGGPLDEPTEARGCTVSLFEVLAVLVIGIVLVLALVPQVHWRRTPGWRMACVNNLKQLGLALDVYHDRHRCYPPAYLCDDRGRPIHSWRTLLLPLLERPDIYQRYDFQRPWNEGQPQVVLEFFVCPAAFGRRVNAPQPLTNYLAVVGPGTAWPGATASNEQMCVDGAHHTLL